MKITKTLFEFIKLADAIDELESIFKTEKLSNTFKFKIMKIREIIDTEYEKVKKVKNPSKEFIDYETERKQLILIHAVYDLEGNLIYEDKDKLYFGDSETYVLELSKKLLKKYEYVIKEQIEKENQFREDINKEFEIEFPSIDLKEIPEFLDWTMFQYLYEFIED